MGAFDPFTLPKPENRYHTVRNQLSALKHNTVGATAVEYGLLAGLVAVGLAGGLGALSDLVNLLFENVGSEAAQVTTNLNDN